MKKLNVLLLAISSIGFCATSSHASTSEQRFADLINDSTDCFVNAFRSDYHKSKNKDNPSRKTLNSAAKDIENRADQYAKELRKPDNDSGAVKGERNRLRSSISYFEYLVAVSGFDKSGSEDRCLDDLRHLADKDPDQIDNY